VSVCGKSLHTLLKKLVFKYKDKNTVPAGSPDVATRYQ